MLRSTVYRASWTCFDCAVLFSCVSLKDLLEQCLYDCAAALTNLILLINMFIVKCTQHRHFVCQWCSFVYDKTCLSGSLVILCISRYYVLWTWTLFLFWMLMLLSSVGVLQTIGRVSYCIVTKLFNTDSKLF